MADRLRHARAVLRARGATCTTCTASSAPIRRSRNVARFHTRPSPTPRPSRRSSSNCARRGCTRLPCRSAFATAVSSATRATRSRARCTRRARPTCAACARRSSGRMSTCGRTHTRGGSSPTRPAVEWRPSKSRSRARRFASKRRLVVVACGAVNSAALLLRSANDKHPDGLANSSGLVGRRYMAHLATMMQGFHPFRKNAAVFQKTVAINDFYFRGPHTTLSAGAHSVARAHARSDGTDGGAAGAAVVLRMVGGARRRLAGDVRRSAGCRQSRHARFERADSAVAIVRTTSRHTGCW